MVTLKPSNQRITQDQPDGQGLQIYVSSAGVRQIQQALTQKGYSTGKVDGRWNQQTAAAARGFEQAHNLEPTGRLEVGLLAALGLTNSIFSAGQGTGPQAVNAARPQGTQAAGPGGDRQVDNQRIAFERTDSPGRPIWLNADGVRQIQQVLNQRGYAAGHLDGNWNNDTAIAATHFQQAQGLEPTGTLTTNLLATGGMSRWERGDFMGGMTARANNPGNPNSETTGSFTPATGRNTFASSNSDGGNSTKSNASVPQDRRDRPATGTG